MIVFKQKFHAKAIDECRPNVRDRLTVHTCSC